MSTFIPFQFDLICPESTPEELSKYCIMPLSDSEIYSKTPPPASNFSIKKEMTPVEDQGSLGTCTSFCVCSALEHMHHRDLSEAHLTHGAEHLCGDCIAGLSLACAHNFCIRNGVCEEKWWPYDNTNICWPSPPNIGGKPLFKFRGANTLYSFPRTGLITFIETESSNLNNEASQPETPSPQSKPNIIKNYLVNQRRPVSISVPVFWKAGWQLGPDIAMPSKDNLFEFLELSNPSADGWHCISICGYDDTTGRFEFKNSWNTWWGNKGYGTIPYNYIIKYNDLAMAGH